MPRILFVGYHCRLNKLFLLGDDGEFAVKVSPFGGSTAGGAMGGMDAGLQMGVV